MTHISCSSCISSTVAKRNFILVCTGALVTILGLGCSNPAVITDSTGGQAGSSKGGSGGGAGTNNPGGAGGHFTLPPLPDASPDRPGGGNCGDGILERIEQCDDGNTESGDGCSLSCQIEANWECPEPGKPCKNLAVCGNGKLTSDEKCDDGNTNDNDGCSSDCQNIDEGYYCPVPGKACSPLCGDKILKGDEKCDDGNTENGDGCSSTCQVEAGFDCKELGKACDKSECGNGITEKGEQCDCGRDDSTLAKSGCKAMNGLFYGDGKGCSKTCTKEPNCLDSSGKTQACTATCGDGNIDPGEECDDSNQADGDGCSSSCKVEGGFTCSNTTSQDSSTCKSGTGQCLELPMIYRDFQPENVASGGHPDFYFLGTKGGGSSTPTTICVPNSGGPAKGNDSTARCWDIAASALLNGKPQFNASRSSNTCACQFSEWSVGNSGQITGGYTQTDSPLSNEFVSAPASVSFTGPSGAVSGSITGYTTGSTGGPIFKGTVPIVKDKKSFDQWFNDDNTVNKTFTGVLEMPLIGSNIYQYASKTHLAGADAGFFPLDTLNSSQATLCNLWPYWNRSTGSPIWSTCTGDQYLFPPRVIQSDCPNQNPLSNGCWVSSVVGVKHDSYFTTEARYYFAYDKSAGISLQFFGDDDLFIFINGVLVLDLGGVHQQLPGKVTVTGDPGVATIIEGGCLDSTGNLPAPTAATYTAGGCTPTNSTPPAPVSPDDFHQRTANLGLNDGKIYEIAIFGADRHPPESNYQLTLQGFTTKNSSCKAHCGDGVATNGEQCDCGDGSVPVPDGCPGPNNNDTYGGCRTDCTYGPFCGDKIVQSDNGGKEECDLGSDNGNNLGKDGCTIGCLKPHFCGDGNVDTGEDCDLGDRNGKKLDSDLNLSDSSDALIRCNTDCSIPKGIVY
jgi:cysteine-rich repeat protein